MIINPILLSALIASALILGALLTMIAYKGAIARIVADQLENELQARSSSAASARVQQSDLCERSA